MTNPASDSVLLENPVAIDPTVIVGVGSSAGGLDAVKQLLSNLPFQSGMAVVVVQHLDPNHVSELVPLLSRATPIPVLAAEDGQRLEPDHIYVMPENVAMVIERGILHLSPRLHGGGLHLPIDQFLRSLAVDQRNRAVSVILSGSGSDGTLGSAEIKAVGGITFAQDAHTAAFSDMPVNAFRSGNVDVVLPPALIARELHRISCGTYVAPGTDADTDADTDATLVDQETAVDNPSGPEDAQLIQQILALLHTATAADFSGYRTSTVTRRIHRRMVLGQKHGLASYLELLKADRAEVNALYRDILINVTSFFRNPEAFESLKTVVFPALLRHKSLKTPLRIWVPGCSTGQEAYSLAMALMEFLDAHPVHPPVQIFGTDINDAVSVEQARVGLYPHSIELDVSPERLHRFFAREDGGYRIGKAIRDLCIFAQHDVTRNPPFSRLDLISCRNLLIYLTPPLQQHVIPMFHFALNPTGYLLLGPSETVGRFENLFKPVDVNNRIYEKRAIILKSHPYLGEARGQLSAAMVANLPKSATTPSANDLQREADRQLLGRYAPAGVLVNEDLEILQFRGRTAPYLESPAGEATFKLLNMARGNLFVDLRKTIDEAKRFGRAAQRQVHLTLDGQPQKTLTVEVLPVRLPGTQSGGYLVLFEGPPAPVAIAPDTAPDSVDVSAPLDEIASLRAELASAREHLAVVVEQQTSVNEEVRAANEEAVSTNEELQSTIEELQTAKEELQSTNEELKTVNDELQARNAEVSQTNSDLTNLLGSMRIPVVMLGMDLCIRRFTPSAAKLLNLIATDIGRPVRHLQPSLPLPDLESLARDVIAAMAPHEEDLDGGSGRWFQLRVHPSRTHDNRIDGAIVILHDITDARLAGEHMRISRDYALSIVNTVREPLLVLTDDLRVKTASQSFYSVFGAARDQVEGRKISELGSAQFSSDSLRDLLLGVLQTGHPFIGHEITDEFPRIGHKTMMVDARRILDELGSELILVAFEDITERLEMKGELKRQIAEGRLANSAKDHFLATLSHELRTPLTPVLLSASSLESRADIPEEVRAELAIMRRNVGLEVRLIDDLLDVTRISRGKIELDRRPNDVSALLAEAIAICRADIDGKGLTLFTDIQVPRPAILADGPRIQQVFWNILRNAIKFTPTGGRIEVHCRNEGDWIVATFIDSGMGIEAKVLSKIFEPFEQGTVEVTRKFGGLGLGLAISRMIATLHQSTLTAESHGKDLGSTFTFRLPINEATIPPATPRPAEAEGSLAPEVLLPARLLLVEDHPDTGMMIARLLDALGYEVKLVRDIAGARKMSTQWKFDLVISDLGLPDGRGTELMAQLRTLHGLTGIALTGFGMAQDREETREAGFVEHLVKPVDFRELAAAIVRCLKAR